MLKFFVDDSGSDASRDGLFVLHGYIMEGPRWEDFADRWDAQLKRPDFFPISYCRMADAEAGTGPFSGIDSVFRKRKVKDLAGVIHECHPSAIGCKMTWKNYNEIVKGKVDSRLDNPYAILFFQVMRGVTEFQLKINNEIPDEVKAQFKREHGIEIAIKPVDFVFDDQGPAGLQCLQWWGALKARVPEPHLTVIGNTPQFKDDREVVPLQAADMLAWHIRREYEYPTEDRADVMTLLNPEGIFEGEVSPEMLHTIVDVFNKRIDPTKL
ncbi:MAG: DUF3800 domain-containing protein [Terracidiphilus sp.]